MKKIKVDQKEYSYELKASGETLEIKIEGKSFIYKKDQLKADIFPQGTKSWIGLKNQSFLLEKMSTKSAMKGEQSLTSPMPGKILKVLVELNQEVKALQPLLILEAMKMEHTIKAPYDGKVTKLPFKAGEQVASGAELIEIEQA
jgi:biotin carboxyl carrier protein